MAGGRTTCSCHLPQQNNNTQLMLTQEVRTQLINLIHQEVVPATGCTEPGAVALCVARCRETLGCMPEKVELKLSKNVFKNAMGVGIPGTGMIGLPIAISMALVAGKSERGLEILTIPSNEVEDAKTWLANNIQRLQIGVKSDCDKLYIECKCTADGHEAVAVIARRHTNFILVEKDGVKLVEEKTGGCQDAQQDQNDELRLTARMVYDFATTSPIEELEFIRETVKLNAAAAQEGLKGLGLNTGRILMENANGDMVHTVVARTVAASDARMDGCTLPVYSNSGSGNQGICCTLPVYEYGKAKGCSEEKITRALIISHLMSIYIKRGIGRLSALCGIVNASTGVASALVYLQGGSFEQMCFAIKNMINTLAGMVCDGAKPSCALKMSAGMYSAFVSSELACHDKVVDATDGIAEKDIDLSIGNLGHLGHDGMDQTDDVVLDIMTHKKN